MKKAIVIITIMSGGLILFGVDHHQKVKKLRSDNELLNTQASSFLEIQNEIARLESININSNALEKLRGETSELMQLRAEAARLRPIADKTDAELEREIRQRESFLDQAKESLDYEARWIIEDGNQRVRNQASQMLVEKMNDYIEEYDHFPNSLTQFYRDFSELMSSEWILNQINNPSLPPEYQGRVGVRLEEFGLLSPPSDFLTRTNRYLVFREKAPRQLQNGSWERYYGILNFHPRSPATTYPVKLEDGDFEKWEREFAEQNSGN